MNKRREETSHLHIVEITQSYRLFFMLVIIYVSTHSRNYLVIQTAMNDGKDSVNLHIVEITQSYRLYCGLSLPLSYLHIVEITQSYRPDGSCNAKSDHLHIVEITQSYRREELDGKSKIIYTQQKLLSHIDLFISARTHVIYTQQKLLSHIDSFIFCEFSIFIYTQQKLLSHIDLPQCYLLHKIYTQQKLLSHIDRLRITSLGRLSTHSRNYLVIQTQAHIVALAVHLHIVEITQSYRPAVKVLAEVTSTHSRNYLVIQTSTKVYWNV